MGRGEGREPDRRWLNGVPPPFRIRRIVRCRTTQALLRLRRENERMRVQNIVIPATDFGSTVTFYRDVLGLPVLQESAAFCFLRAGGRQYRCPPRIAGQSVRTDRSWNLSRPGGGRSRSGPGSLGEGVRARSAGVDGWGHGFPGGGRPEWKPTGTVRGQPRD